MLEKFSLEDQKALKWGGLLVAIVISVIVLAVIGYVNSGPGYDKQTLCEYDQPFTAHNVILIDTTDSLSPFQLKFMDKEIDELIKKSEMGTRYTVFLISNELGGLSDPEFNMCQPSDGTGMNPLYQAPALAKKKFDESFLLPFKDLILSLDGLKNQSTSPLAEAISDVFKLSVFDGLSTEQNIYFFSDMLQNSPKGSVFKGEAIPKVTGCAPTFKLDDFNAYVLGRPEHKARQSAELLTNWTNSLGTCTKNFKPEQVRY